MVGAIVPVLPQNAIVLLMHTDRVLDCAHTPIILGHVGIEIVNHAQAIATKLKGVSEPADPILSHIEGVLESMIRAGITVGDSHFGQPQTTEQRTSIIENVVEDKALAR